MEIPKSINILGVKYKVIVTDNIKTEIKTITGEEIGSRVNGHWASNPTIIWISSNMDKQQMISVFLHEIIEVLIFMLGIKCKHEDIRRLETGVYQVLTTNKLI